MVVSEVAFRVGRQVWSSEHVAEWELVNGKNPGTFVAPKISLIVGFLVCFLVNSGITSSFNLLQFGFDVLKTDNFVEFCVRASKVAEGFEIELFDDLKFGFVCKA